MEYDITTFPEGYEKVKNEELSFLPDERKEQFLSNFVFFLMNM